MPKHLSKIAENFGIELAAKSNQTSSSFSEKDWQEKVKKYPEAIQKYANQLYDYAIRDGDYPNYAHDFKNASAAIQMHRELSPLLAMLRTGYNSEHKGKTTYPLMQTSATKSSNFLTKNYGAEKIKNWGSNPYDSHQSFQHTMPARNAAKLLKDMKEDGWKPSKYSKDYYEHPQMPGGVQTYKGKTLSGKAKTWVTVHGKKKAKPTSIPYYD